MMDRQIERLIAHLLIGTTLSLLFGTATFAAAAETLDYPASVLLSGIAVLIGVVVLAGTGLLSRVGIDFRDEPAVDRTVVFVAYLAAVVLSPFVAAAIWSVV